MKGPPRRILLATDLSARSDRAQDRAVSLMKQYDAGLLVVHVLEPTKPNRTAHCVRFSTSFNPDEKLIKNARSKILEYLGDGGNQVAVRIEKGDPHHAILKVAIAEQCDLIVSGVARNEMLGRIAMGKTVEHLMSNSEIPLLIVTDRVLSPYQNIVVPLDFSDTSRQALEVAAAFFPDKKLTVLHAHATPGSWAATDRDNYRDQMRRMAYEDCMAFLDTVDLPKDKRAGIGVLIEWGEPSQLLQDLVQCSSADLVVVGSRVRGVLLNFLFGSIAKRIVSTLSCDALVVRGRRSLSSPSI